MTQLAAPVEPFGEVNVYKQQDGSVDVVATVLMVPDIEGARTNPTVATLVGIARALKVTVSELFEQGDEK